MVQFTKSPAFRIGIFVVAMAMIAGGFLLSLSSSFRQKSIAIDGMNLTYYQGGHGPSLVFLSRSPKWQKALRPLAKRYRVFVLSEHIESPEQIEKWANALNLQDPYLIAVSKDAKLALEVLAQSKSYKAQLILINPEIELSPDIQKLGSKLSEPILILRSRSGILKGRQVGRGLSGILPSSQLSIEPHAGPSLIEDDPEWVIKKVEQFISFTSKSNEAKR